MGGEAVGLRIDPKDLAVLRDVEVRVRDADLDDGSETAIPPWLASELCSLFRCDRFAGVRPACEGDGRWHYVDAVGARVGPGFFQSYNAGMDRTAMPLHYNPLRPEAWQRNRVLFLRESHRHAPDVTCVVEDSWPSIGLGGMDQMRALVCDGTTLLAWVGGFRPHPFTERERALFRMLLPALRRALSLRRRMLDADLVRAGLAQALEAIGAPAFIAHADGRIVHANRGGEALRRRWGRSAPTHLREILRAPGPCLVARLASPGTPRYALVVVRQSREPSERRLSAASCVWRLTERETEVLRWLTRGDCNKEIAIRVGCAEVSVERHVTSILRKTRCDSRARLLARFWTGP